jgi:ElaB/YqjD/DUF883 family membrane-anchored ribosome-binding protein
MDQHRGHSSQNLKMEEMVMTENMGRINERVQETVEGVQSTVHRAMEGFKQMQTTGEEVKTAVDDVLERVKGTVNEMTERVKPAANLLGYAQQNPWLLVGGAVLLGYIFGSLAREDHSAH